MKNQAKSNLQQYLFLAVMSLTFLFTANYAVSAQTYKVGDRVEVDPSGIQSWIKGTVIAFLEKDEPTFQGEYYLARVLIDKWKSTYPEGVLLQTKHIRSLKGETIKPTQNQNKPKENEPRQNEFGANERSFGSLKIYP